MASTSSWPQKEGLAVKAVVLAALGLALAMLVLEARQEEKAVLAAALAEAAEFSAVMAAKAMVVREGQYLTACALPSQAAARSPHREQVAK